jgi:hypothetical protein
MANESSAAWMAWTNPRGARSIVAALGVAAVVALATSACRRGGPTDPLPPGGGRVLFIGNSLTSWNNLPEIVAALADSAGTERIVPSEVTYGDFSLEDHWGRGDSRVAIAHGGWELVVLQQGPSSLEANRALLIDYSRRFAGEIRRVGAEPALYGVWPQLPDFQTFDRAIESYALAAQEIDALLFPVGAAWRAAWQREPSLELYSSDGLHPSLAGSYLAALVMYARISGHSPIGLPSRLQLASGIVIAIPDAEAALLQAAAADVAARAAVR